MSRAVQTRAKTPRVHRVPGLVGGHHTCRAGGYLQLYDFVWTEAGESSIRRGLVGEFVGLLVGKGGYLQLDDILVRTEVGEPSI